MSQSNTVKIIVYVPESHADNVRNAMGEAGAGRIGNYTYCSFSVTGVGRFLPQPGANPTIGNVGTLEEVQEERIEVTCERIRLKEVVEAIKTVHPYEEIAMDVYALEDIVF